MAVRDEQGWKGFSRIMKLALILFPFVAAFLGRSIFHITTGVYMYEI